MSTVKPVEDLSVTIGGRRVSPALPVVDASTPTALELSFQSLLTSYMNMHVPLESTDGIRKRERVLDRLGNICTEWVQYLAREAGLPEDVIRRSRGLLYTSGSYRLGIHEPDADMDIVLVCPNVCTRKEFFGSGYVSPEMMMDLDSITDPKEQQALRESLKKMRDPQSLAERIKKHPQVTNCIPIENATVPILTFDFDGVSVDLLFARIHSKPVLTSTEFDIDDDAVLDGVDMATEKSLNGPRVTNLIAALVSAHPERYQNFLTVVRCVRKWAKARGLYSNKFGFWGGVNINIAVALVVQLYPNACAASLLRKFFLVFKSWRWPNPVILAKPHDAGYGLHVWTAGATVEARLHNVAPMITPAYPAMNSAASISRQTLQILIEEFSRAHDIMDRAWRQHVACGGMYLNQPQSYFAQAMLGPLFELSDFFISYPFYLSVCIVGPTEADAQTWAGFVESRLRKLVSDLLGRNLPLSKIQLWPKKLDACVADRSALLTLAQRKNSITYFIGFQVDRMRMKGTALNVEQQIQKFSQFELSKYYAPLVQGMDVLVKVFSVKNLPTICFDGIYEGGKLAAMKKRRSTRDSDPARIMAKNDAKLATIKARMNEINKKKSLLVGTNQSTNVDESNLSKRKRSMDEQEGEDIVFPIGNFTKVKLEEEQALLDHALDEIQGNTVEGIAKSKEEAERDRQKLLSGEGFIEPDIVDSNRIDDDDDDEPGYGPEGARKLVASEVQSKEEIGNIVMSIAEREAEVLRQSGYHVLDEDVVIIGSNLIHPWRQASRTMPTLVSDNSDSVDDPNPRAGSRSLRMAQPTVQIRFRTKFDVVDLDVNGKVVDKGDDDFSPSLRWIGRRPGFEFKLGDRGLGYYRTGRPVIIPSNLAY